MAVKAAHEVTITDETDIDKLVTWYYLTTSAIAPSAPTTTQTSVAPPSPWTANEPTFQAGTITNYLYTCIQTQWKDGSCTWSTVQLSSSYEQAKQAWNKANAAADDAASARDDAKRAQDSANDAIDSISDLDSFVRGVEYVPTTDETAQFAYSIADVSAGDSVSGMYELIDETYVQTSDSTAQAGKEYYIKALKTYYNRTGSGTADDPYVYSEASVSAGDSVTGKYELVNDNSFVGRVDAAQDELQKAIDELGGRADALETGNGALVDELSELEGTVSGMSDALAVANYREQTVYISAPDGTATMLPSTVWADAVSDQGVWTSVRPHYDSDYPVLFTATQRQTVDQADSNECSCTDPVIDETTTIIDGGRIITNSITASKINVESLWAALMQADELLIGRADSFHIEANGDALLFMDGEGKPAAYIEVDPQTGESTFYMTRSVVVEDMYFGDGLWKFYRRSNRNMSLKWMGGE